MVDIWENRNGVISKIDVGADIQTLDQSSLRLPDGVYTTFRTYNQHYIFRFEDHINRLKESARITGVETQIAKEEIIKLLRVAINYFTHQELRLRITCIPGTIFLAATPFSPPSHASYLQGVHAATIQLSRINPLAKKSEFIKYSQSARDQLNHTIHEMIMVNQEGYLLEGLSSNFYGVIDNQIYTSGKDVLPGITQKIIFEEASKSNIPVQLSPIHRSEIGLLSEAFITSSGRAVLPVVSIDQTVIGNGKPGKISELLLISYQNRIFTDLFDLLAPILGENDTSMN